MQKSKLISYLISFVLAVIILAKLINYHRSPATSILSEEELSEIYTEDFNIVFGQASAPAKMVLYYNYACPSCRLFMGDAFLSIKRDYIDTGYLYAILKPVELDQNEMARLDINAILCMDKMGLFLPMNEYLTLKQQINQSTEQMMIEFSQLNDELLYCLENSESNTQIELNNKQLGKINITSTPTIILNNKIYKGAFPYTVLKRIIDQDLK